MLTRLAALAATEWKLMLIAVFSAIFAVFANIGLMGSAAYLISAAALQPPLSALSLAIVSVRFFGLSRAAFRYAERLLSHNASLKLLTRLQVSFYQAVETLAPGSSAYWKKSDLWQRAVHDVDKLKFFYLRVIQPPVVAAAILAGAAVCLALFDWRFAGVLAAGFVFGGIIIPVLTFHRRQRLAERLITEKSRLSGELADCILGMEETCSYGSVNRQLDRIVTQADTVKKIQLRLTNAQGVSSSLSMAAINLTIWAGLLLGAFLVEERHIEGVFLAVIPLVIQSSFEAVFPLLSFPFYLDDMQTAARRLCDVAAQPAGLSDPLQSQSISGGYNVRFEKISFSYPGRTVAALEDISFVVPEGGRIAIVGPSGAGKSTLASLLMRFFDYSCGSIYLAGTELRQLNQEDIRQQIGLVPQEVYLFHATVRENLLLARPEATEEELWTTLHQVYLADKIRALPLGIDTVVGADGHLLSGGERRRIGIARALLKQSPILLLDEPSTGLDAVTERAIMDTIYAVSEGKTMIVITHRLVDLDKMDEILVMNQGQVVERGTLNQLLDNRGLFYEMWRQQRDLIAQIF